MPADLRRSGLELSAVRQPQA